MDRGSSDNTSVSDGMRHVLHGYEGFEEKLVSSGAIVALGIELAL